MHVSISDYLCLHKNWSNKKNRRAISMCPYQYQHKHIHICIARVELLGEQFYADTDGIWTR